MTSEEKFYWFSVGVLFLVGFAMSIYGFMITQNPLAFVFGLSFPALLFIISYIDINWGNKK